MTPFRVDLTDEGVIVTSGDGCPVGGPYDGPLSRHAAQVVAGLCHRATLDGQDSIDPSPLILCGRLRVDEGYLLSSDLWMLGCKLGYLDAVYNRHETKGR